MGDTYGKKVWIFPDGDLPPAGDSLLKGHESVIILNPNQQAASLQMTLYFADREPVEIKGSIEVEAERVRGLRMDNTEDLNGFDLPLETQYAIKLVSDQPVIVQYGRLDARQQNLAYYTTMGYNS